ncbi:MAG TPA: hypothetical protein VMI54_10905 [Polyangiaceae bacterium]|nr:hypothetical protein [Polyangiaceae bacterium]
MQLGALGAVGLAAACSTSAPGGDNTGGTGPSAGGSGAAAGKGGTGTGGTTGGTGGGTGATGGTTGGTGGTTGGTTGGSGMTTGGSGGSAGSAAGHPGTGGSGQAGSGTSAGGAPATGGTSPGGGSPATGGTSPGAGMGGTSSGGSGGTGAGGCTGWKEANYTPVATLPAGTMGPSQKMVPDPFKFIDGTRISSMADWERLRADLSAMLQAAVYGPKMPPPDKLTATLSGGTVTVNCTVGSKSGSFTFTIKGGGTKPSPAVIRCASSGNPFPSTVATIDFDEHSIAQENKMWPTTGLVTTLYGNTAAKSGSDICWAWGASRIIDALEQLGADQTGIDPHALAATGCSFAGKGAFAMGAFDERFVLVAPEEAGSGGAALWRVSSAEAAKGQNIQEATEIVGEQNWQGKDFHDLFSGKSKTNAPVDMLIADQHFLVALCAPRACLIIDNDIDWLGPLATYAGGVLGKKVYQALGIADRCEVSVAPNHTHCSFPSNQQADLTAFINRFLLKQAGATTAAKDVLNDTNSTIKTYTESDWISWDTPTLTGSLCWDPFASM